MVIEVAGTILVVVFVKLIIKEIFFLLLVPQVSWRTDAHLVQGELARRVVHDAYLLSLVRLGVHHVDLVASDIAAFSTTYRLSFVHRVLVLQNAQIVSIRSHGMTWRRWMGQRRNSLLVLLVFDIQRVLLHFVLVTVFEREVIEVSSIQLRWATSLIARIFVILCHSLAWSHRVIAEPFLLQAMLDISVFGALWQASYWVRVSVPRLDDLSTIVLVLKHLIMQLLFLPATVRALPLSYTFFLEFVV